MESCPSWRQPWAGGFDLHKKQKMRFAPNKVNQEEKNLLLWFYGKEI